MFLMEKNVAKIRENSGDKESYNFILPRTEEAINSVIAEIAKAFDRVRIYVSAVYLVYLILRLAWFSVNRILDIVYISLYTAQFVFLLLANFGKIKIPIATKIVKFIKYIPTLGMFVLVCCDVFYDLSRLYPWQVVLTIFMGIGWVLLLLGDLFVEFVPKYAERILTSFKQDIQVKDLVSRSVSQMAGAAKDAIKSDEGKKVLKTGGAMVVAALVGKGLKSLMDRRSKK